MTSMADFEPFALGDYKGWVAAPHASTLVDWFRSNGTGELVKQGPSRDVILLKGPPAVYLKRLRNEPGLIGKVRRSGMMRARREFRNLLVAAQNGISAPKPVALLVGRGDALLATEGLEKSIVLKSLIAGRGLNREETSGLVDALSKLVDKLSHVGLRHEELDTGHLMIGRGTLPPRLTLIDVESARELKRPLTPEERMDMVVPLLYSFGHFVPATDAMRLARALGYKSRAEQKVLVARCREHAYRQARARARRAVSAGPGFYRDTPGSAVVHGSREFPIEKALEHMRRLMTSPRVKKLPGRELVRTTPEVCAKVFLYPGVAGALRRGLGTEAGWRTWYNGHLLRVCGIPTPEPMALFQEPDKTAVFQEWIPESMPMGDYIRRAFPGWDRRRRREFLRRLARLVREMHDRGIVHGDLKANNILVRERPDRTPDFYVIDLDRVRHTSAVSRADIVKNLAQLNAAVGPPLTLTERAWFLRAYIGRDRTLHKDRKALIAGVMKATSSRNHVFKPPAGPNP